MIRTILKHPNKILNTVCEPVTKFDDSLRALAANLIDSLVDADRQAVGLAANQIGDLRRVFIMYDARVTSPIRIFVNPVVTKARGEQTGLEGCLSLTPADDCEITRAKIINWEAQDIDGEPIKGKFSGFDARVFQHELDHLDGILIIDKKGE